MSKISKVKATKPKVGELELEPEPVICPRCKGDGFWHSPRTGYRARTASEPLVDRSRKCDVCKGKGKV